MDRSLCKFYSNWDTCIFVIKYVMLYYPNHREFHDVVVMGVDRIARSYREKKNRRRDYLLLWNETMETRRELYKLFVNSIIPEVQKFFNVIKLHWLSDKYKHLKPNEVLGRFIDFTLQLLHHQGNIWSDEEQLYTLIRNQLTFLLAILGDAPFQPSHLGFEEQLKSILQEFEMPVNEVVSLIFSISFPVYPRHDLLVKAEFLNANIKNHCDKFSKLPMYAISRPVLVDSLFIVDSVIEDIVNLENRETNFTDADGTKSQIGMLKDKLNTSKRLIKVTDHIPRGGDTNEQKEALIKLRDLAYEAEYLINSHAVGNIPAWYLNLRLPSIVQKIEIVNEILQRVEKMQGRNVTKAVDEEISSGMKGSPATVDDSDFLTFHDDREKNILRDLCRSSIKSREIISISGMPGIGKTTTAIKLYNCPECSEHFDRRAWFVVSQKFSLRDLFAQILRDIAPDDDTVPGKENAQLGESIHKTLYGRRYLIVLDDVWESDVLDKLIRYLPDAKNGSRVLVTSRATDVAPSDSFFHTLPLLSNDQCWHLLKKKVFPNPKEPCPLRLHDVGKQIAEKCCGIPLAVVNTAGILVNLEKEISVWERVAEQLDVLLLDDKSDYKKILELSYEHLPSNLKPCFLYFARFLEDSEISKKELTWFWIAEGFIPKGGKKSLEETAEMYFVDLINRSLVQPGRRGSDGRISTCRIHDLLRDICVAKAMEENFVNSSTNSDYSIYGEHHHLCLTSGLSVYRRHFGFRSRSLSGSPTEQLCYHTMPLLKVLDLAPNYYDSGMYPHLDLPIQLRYLRVGDLRGIMVANLVKLEFIHVRGCSIIVPSVILRMEKLKHLLIKPKAEFEEDCSNITEPTNLRSLSYVRINRKKDQNILRCSPHLQELKCKIGGDEILFPDLSALGELESLRIDYKRSFSGEILLSEASFPSTIKKLCLKQSKLRWEKMSIIGKLPKLQVLKLESGAFVGEEWETNYDEFQELRFLKIESCWTLKEWRSESSHFPSLEHLVMGYCFYLKEIPTDLGYIQSLQRIDVRYCSTEAVSSAKKIETEQHENANPGLQVYAATLW